MSRSLAVPAAFARSTCPALLRSTQMVVLARCPAAKDTAGVGGRALPCGQTVAELAAVADRLTTSSATALTPLLGTPAVPVTCTVRTAPAPRPALPVSSTTACESGWNSVGAAGVTAAAVPPGDVPERLC